MCLKAASFFAWEFFHDRIAWITDAEATPSPVVQGFTHGGPERIKADIEQFRKILGEDQPDLPKNWGRMIMMDGTDLTPEPHPITPLEDALRTVRSEALKGPEHKRRLAERLDDIISIDVDTVLEILKAEASKSPLHKARLWKRITVALGMEKPEKVVKRRRKKLSKKDLFQKNLVGFKADPSLAVPKRKPGRPKKIQPEEPATVAHRTGAKPEVPPEAAAPPPPVASFSA